MTLEAHITTERHNQPWLWITAPNTAGTRSVIFDAPLNLSTKSTTKAEIDFAHERSGIPRPDLYDAIRTYRRGEKVSRNAA